ncbi:MAG: hypothetical protein ACLGHN_14305 [Bacteriovoracia bacterium]
MQSDLSDWLLTHYGQEQMRPGLSRMKEALKDLFPYFKNTKIITVAGTNGKGETTLRLSKLLGKGPHYVWTSPHIVSLTERMRNQKGEIPAEVLKSLILSCHEEVGQRKLELSYYEFLFFVFCKWFSEAPAPYVLLEVGLGGRLDAVNVFDADLVLLPSLSRDHQEILGKRYDQILSEKLGTLRGKTKLFHFLESEYLLEKAHSHARSLGAEVFALKRMTDVPVYEFSLRNYILAGAAYCSLRGEEFIPERWSKTPETLKHRGETITNENEWIFFGSHNTDGMRKLIQFLQRGTYNFKRPPFDRVIVSFSKRNPEDTRVMLRMLMKAQIGKVVVTVFDHPKAASKDVMEDLSREEGSEFVQNINSFIEGQQGQRILVTGSYYFLGYLKSCLRS